MNLLNNTNNHISYIENADDLARIVGGSQQASEPPINQPIGFPILNSIASAKPDFSIRGTGAQSGPVKPVSGAPILNNSLPSTFPIF